MPKYGAQIKKPNKTRVGLVFLKIRVFSSPEGPKWETTLNDERKKYII